MSGDTSIGMVNPCIFSRQTHGSTMSMDVLYTVA